MTKINLRYTTSMIAIGTMAAAGCTSADHDDVAVDTAGLTGEGGPVVTGDGSDSADAAAIQFHFDPIETEDGRVFDSLSLVPVVGGSPGWDESTLDPSDPATFPPAGFGFAVEIRDLSGQMILESEPRLLYAADFLASEDHAPVRAFASATWTFHAVEGGLYEIDPTAPGATEWLDQIEGMVMQLAGTDWDPIEEPADDVPVEPTPEEPAPIDLPPTGVTSTTSLDGESLGDPALRIAGGPAGPSVQIPAVPVALREIPEIEDNWVEIFMTCWDAVNEMWHWYDIYEKKCFAGQPPKRDLTLKGCAWAISGLTNKTIQVMACAYVAADKLGLVPSSATLRKLAKALLVSYALSGKPQDVPPLPPPPEIRKPK